MKIINSLYVFANSEKVGILTRTKTRTGGDIYEFKYDAKANIGNPISLMMPVREQSYVSSSIHPAFETSMPEGYLAAAMIRRFGREVLPDDMGLLYLTGKSRIGHVQLSDKDVRPSAILSDIQLPQELTQDKLGEYVDRVLDQYGDQSGVSGTMPKIIIGNDARLTSKNNTHILKFDSHDLPYISANEYFCLSAARRAGMSVPNSELHLNGKAIAIERFDIKDKNDNSCRFGFEDICSLMGLQSNLKYSFASEQLAARVMSITNNPNDQLALFDANVFSHITRNGDAHLKNYGILYDGYNSIKLAPIYDLITTTAYDHFSNDKAALSLRGSYEWGSKVDFILAGKLKCYGVPDDYTSGLFDRIEFAINETACDMIDFAINSDDNVAYDIMKNMLLSWREGLISIEKKTDHIDDCVNKILLNRSHAVDNPHNNTVSLI